LIGVHEAFLDGPTIESGADALWAEFQACLDLGLDPDIEFAKDRFSRMLITGGVVASRAIRSMRDFDMEKLRSQQAEMARKRRGK
jgi:hypothetical protein